MKRLGNIYNKLYSYNNLLMAHEMAKKGKFHYSEVKKVEENKKEYLNHLSFLLENGLYNIHKDDYIIQTMNDNGKEREIMKTAYYPHRIVQWALMLQIEDRLLKTLTFDTYSSIKKRGLHRCAKNVRRAMGNKDETVYCLKLDIRKYYPNINKEILYNLYKRLIKDKETLSLIKKIIYSDGNQKGQPIGSLLSQWSGNIYLSPLDHYVKEKLKVKYYFRYCDDIVIFGKTKKELRYIFNKIDAFVSNVLDLEIKSNYQIFPTDVRGVDFLGLRFFRNYTLLRKKILLKMKTSIGKINKTRTLSYHDFCTINSYMGWLKSCNSFRLFTKYIQPFNGMKYYNYNGEIRRVKIWLK